MPPSLYHFNFYKHINRPRPKYIFLICVRRNCRMLSRKTPLGVSGRKEILPETATINPNLRMWHVLTHSFRWNSHVVEWHLKNYTFLVFVPPFKQATICTVFQHDLDIKREHNIWNFVFRGNMWRRDGCNGPINSLRNRVGMSEGF